MEEGEKPIGRRGRERRRMRKQAAAQNKGKEGGMPYLSCLVSLPF
jgi:hypothetical protein